MDSARIKDLAVQAGLLHASPSESSHRFYTPQMASFSEVLLFARMIERERDEEIRFIRKIEVGG